MPTFREGLHNLPKEVKATDREGKGGDSKKDANNLFKISIIFWKRRHAGYSTPMPAISGSASNSPR
jgi:hypothetical protein